MRTVKKTSKKATKASTKTVRTNLTERVSPYVTKTNKTWVEKQAKSRKVAQSVIINEALNKVRTNKTV
jgi:hypothetical protein